MKPPQFCTGTTNFAGIVRIHEPNLSFCSGLTDKLEESHAGLPGCLGHERTNSGKTRIDIPHGESFAFTPQAQHGCLVGIDVVTSNDITPLFARGIFMVWTFAPSLFIFELPPTTSIAVGILGVMR
jgi:hypothetical protein